MISWYELIVKTFITSATVLIVQLQDRLEPLINWYQANNVVVGIVPTVMFVPIIDFVLVSIGIFLFGWFLLKWLS